LNLICDIAELLIQNIPLLIEGDFLVVESDVKAKILGEIGGRKDEIIDFLQNLVKIPSIVGYEGDAQRFIERKFRELNLEVDVFEADVEELRKDPAFFETTSYIKMGYKNRPNVVGKLQGSENGKSMIFCGHIDVVSPEPTEAWKHEPWEAEISNGRLYGRGASDMKAGIAAIIYALQCIQDVGIKLKGHVTLESTIEEEDGGIGGALATILRGYTADAAILTEPTNVQFVGVASAGVMYFRVKVSGKPAHAAVAHRGINAIGKAIKIYNALMRLNRERQSRIKYHLAERFAPDLRGRVTTLNIGVIRGGDWPSTVPGWAELECRIGWPPGENLKDIREQIENVINKTAMKDPWLRRNPPKIEWMGWQAEPSEQNIGHPLVQTVEKYAKEVTGKSVTFYGGHAGLDTRHFIAHYIPAITYGPRGENYHSVDEYVEVNSVVDVTKVLALTLLDWCGYK
jgi:acetylornithine deacetylase